MRDPYGATPKRLDLSVFRYTPTALQDDPTRLIHSHHTPERNTLSLLF